MERVKKYKLENNERVEVGTYIRDSLWDKDESSCYIVGINNWIINSEGKFLVQRRALTKKNNPGKWSSTNGLVQLEESAIETVIRETKEELGIDINPNQILLYKKNQIAGEHLLVDIFITHIDISLDDIIIQENEVDMVNFVSLDELLSLDISSTCSYIKEYGKDMLDIIQKQFASAKK